MKRSGLKLTLSLIYPNSCIKTSFKDTHFPKKIMFLLSMDRNSNCVLRDLLVLGRPFLASNGATCVRSNEAFEQPVPVCCPARAPCPVHAPITHCAHVTL